MLHIVRFLPIIICCLLSNAPSFAQSRSATANFTKWIDMPLPQLLKTGNQYQLRDSLQEAQMCFNIVAERGYTSKKREEQLLCVDACMHLWSIYFYTYYDYPRCFDYLNKAREMIEELNVENARVWLGLACMYQTISEECHSHELGSKSLEYYIKAMNAAISRTMKTTPTKQQPVLSLWHPFNMAWRVSPMNGKNTRNYLTVNRFGSFAITTNCFTRPISIRSIRSMMSQ